MKLEDAIKELESLSPSENAIQAILKELNELRKENENLKSYLSKQHLINDYIKYKRKKVEKNNGN